MNSSLCTLCPRECRVDRSSTPGFCNSTGKAKVGLYQPHFWEEPVLSGEAGSGAIFFSNCAMRCVYCQNFKISQEGRGSPRSIQELSEMMLELQGLGCHNVNLVTASHYADQAVASLIMARKNGLRIPVVWNSSAYEKPETLRMLEGLVDVYLPDFRYYGEAEAARYSSASDYPMVARGAVLEMFRQVGHLAVSDGLAMRGLIVRIMVMPGLIDQVRKILIWIRDQLGPETWISLMGQYYPTYKAADYPEINRSITSEEYRACAGFLDELGFENGFLQEVGSCADYTPDFTGPVLRR